MYTRDIGHQPENRFSTELHKDKNKNQSSHLLSSRNVNVKNVCDIWLFPVRCLRRNQCFECLSESIICHMGRRHREFWANTFKNCQYLCSGIISMSHSSGTVKLLSGVSRMPLISFHKLSRINRKDYLSGEGDTCYFCSSLR